MDIKKTQVGDVLILCPQGRLDALSAPHLQETTLGHVDAGMTRLVLDLEGVDYLSSAGLRAVLMAATRLKEMGGRLVVCSLHGFVLEVFGTSGFDQIIETALDRSTALATFP